MKLWVAAVAALRLAPLAAEPPCKGELQRVLVDAQQPGQVGGDFYDARGNGDKLMLHAQETSFLFNNLPERCLAEYRAWQKAALPSACKAKYAAFSSRLSTPQPRVRLPAWKPAAKADATPVIAYLVSASDPKSVPVLKRTFDKLYRPEDVWVYLVDTHRAPKLLTELRRALPHSNVKVEPAQRHAMLYYWPRVESVLTALTGLLEDTRWTHVYHLSESDYPLHGRPPPLAGSRGPPSRTDRIFTDSIPHAGDTWYWWKDRTGVFDCEGYAVPDRGVQFPGMDELEASGLRFHRGGEWFGFPRRFAEYLVAPESQGAVANYTELMRHRWSSDEVFWATLVRSVPGLEADLPVSPGWFLLWDMQQGHSPDDFEGEALARHEGEILASDRLFVRKVSLPGSAELLARLDA